MSVGKGSGVNVYIGLLPLPSTLLGFTFSKDSVTKTITGNEDNKVEEKCDELGDEIERVIRCHNSPYIILPNSVQMHGSGLHLPHSGRIDGEISASKLGEDAWNELWRTGSFWLLCCAAPSNFIEGKEGEEKSNPNIFEGLRGSDELVLEYLVVRLFDLVSCLRTSVVRWTEGGGSLTEAAHTPFWRNSFEKSDEFTETDTLIGFVRENFKESKKESLKFSFSLVSVTFCSPTSEKPYEIVIAAVNSRFDSLSVTTSSSLVAVRTWFANMSHVSMNYSCEGEENAHAIFEQLKLCVAEVFPEEVLYFILTHCNWWNNGDTVNSLAPSPPRVVYAIVETHDGVSTEGSVEEDEEEKEDVSRYESAFIAIVRHLSFWCSLGPGKVYEDINKNLEDCSVDYKGTVRESTHSLKNTFRHIKHNLLTLLVDAGQFSQLLSDLELANNTNNKGGDVLMSSSIFLEALERFHSTSQHIRHNGLRKRVRRIICSRPRNTPMSKGQASDVNTTMKLFGMENEALLWCQKLEERYYLVLYRVFYADWEIHCNTALVQENRFQEEQQEYIECTMGSNTPKEGELTQVASGSHQNSLLPPISILSVKEKGAPSLLHPYSCKLTSSSLLRNMGCGLRVDPVHNLLRRLSDVENTRRLLITISAADSLNLILLSSLHNIRCYNDQLMTSLNTFASIQHGMDMSRENEFITLSRDDRTFLELVHGHLSNGADLLHALEYTNEKMHWFTESILHLQQKNTEKGIHNSSPRVDAVTQTSITLFELLNRETDGPCCGSGESCTVARGTPRHCVLEGVSTTTSACALGHEANTALPQQPSDVGDNTVLCNSVHDKGALSRSTTHMMILHAEHAPCESVVVGNEVKSAPDFGKDNPDGLRVPVEHSGYSEFLKGGTIIGRPHRLHRDGVGTQEKEQQCGYRQLLSTGRSPNAEKYSHKGTSRLPPLSFSDITEERKHWSKPEDLDDYRRLLAYNVYLVGEGGCGKSSLIHSLAIDKSTHTFPPPVPPHTMTMKRTSLIVKLPLQKEPLPLGGFRDATMSDMRNWMNLVDKAPVHLSSVGVNFVETSTPLLLAASTGSVKLPIRGAAYYIVYHLQDNWETMQCTIGKYMRALQTAVTPPSSHIINALKSCSKDVEDANLWQKPLPIPVVLVGTHADLVLDGVSRAQERLYQLRQWFEEASTKLREMAGRDKPYLFLVDSCFTSTFNFTAISEYAGVSTTFESLLWRTLWFLHHTAPSHPVHFIARWLPRMFFTGLGLQKELDNDNRESVNPPTFWSNFHGMDSTLEGFWKTHSHPCTSPEGPKQHPGTSNTLLPSQMLSVWWKHGSEGLIVFFTALQRLRQFVSCSFDEQLLDNAALYHLGFALPDDPDETTVVGEEDVDREREFTFRMRDIFLESIFEECRLRGVLLYLPLSSTSHVAGISVSTKSTATLPQRMVTVGTEWVESLWTQTLTPLLVVHHTRTLLQNRTKTTRGALMAVLNQCVSQLGIMIPAVYFDCVWPQSKESTTENVSRTGVTSSDVHKIQEYFLLYFYKGLVSLELLQLLWRFPHRVLAKNRESATMGLIASGLVDEIGTSEMGKLSGNDDGSFFTIPCVTLKNENTL